jgi:HK97 family phage major capsid protein/HK97 family phage prohead protease
MDFDLTTPEGVRALQKHLKKLSAADALRIIADNQTRAGGELFTRCMSGIRVVEGEQRTFDLSFSSESPVERYFGTEVLGHKDGEVDLDWLKSGNAPLLWMHDGKSQVGVIKSASHDSAGKRCDARCRCANDIDGDRYFARVQDGIIKNTSVGYSIQEWERIDDPSDEDAPPTYRATRWKPHEVSLVSTPADETVGVGRSRSFTVPDTKSTSSSLNPPSPPAMPTAEETAAAVKTEQTRLANEAIANERKRLNALHKLRRTHDSAGVVTDAEFATFTDDPARGELEFRQFLEGKGATPVRMGPSGVIVTEPDRQDDYSLVRALRGLVFGNMEERYTKEDRRLRELSPHLKPAGSRESAIVTTTESVRGNILFSNARDIGIGNGRGITSRAQTAQQLVAGGALVGVTFAPEVIEYLRPVPVMQAAGSIVMSGITGGPGTIRFPKQAGDIYAAWAASQVASTPGQLPFGVLDLTPKRLVAQVRIDKQLLLQESFDIEAYVRNSINLQFALSYDLAGLIGNGNGMPLGILNTPNIQSGAVTFNGPSASSGTLAPQFLNFTQFISKVLAANAGMLGKRSYITSPQSMINWATVPKAAAGTTITNAAFMLEFKNDPDGGQGHSVLGERVESTTYLNTLPTPYSAAGFTLPVPDVVLYGPFNQYMFIEWAGVEWIYDPYTQAASDLIVLTARLYVDGGCRQPTAFVTSSNAGSVPYVA